MTQNYCSRKISLKYLVLQNFKLQIHGATPWKSLSFPESLRAQNPSKTKKHSQELIVGIISCQRTSDWIYHVLLSFRIDSLIVSILPLQIVIFQSLGPLGRVWVTKLAERKFAKIFEFLSRILCGFKQSTKCFWRTGELLRPPLKEKAQGQRTYCGLRAYV